MRPCGGGGLVENNTCTAPCAPAVGKDGRVAWNEIPVVFGGPWRTGSLSAAKQVTTVPKTVPDCRL